MAYRIGPEGVSNSSVEIVNTKPKWDEYYETIERKGKGHPDTIADTLAAKVSQAYSLYTTQHCEGLVLHHQIDKLMVIGGKTEVNFGGGKFVEPIRIVVAGRASYQYGDQEIPVTQIVEEKIREHFRQEFPLVLDEDIVIENYLTNHAGPGTITQSSGAIARMFDPKDRNQVRGYDKLVANDTSYCVAYEPKSQLEAAILKIENYLNGTDAKVKYPWLGTDIKIMAVRNGNNISITTCIPMIAKYTPNFESYMSNLNVIGQLVDEMFAQQLPGHDVQISINTKDDYDKMNVYLTVSGASLSGDIGVVGRGNRTNGLITSNRPMSMEGTNGKNPRYYSGFIYANLTKRIAKRIYEETGEANIVEIVSQNGGLLKEPWQVRIVSQAIPAILRAILAEELENIENITSEFINGSIENY